MALPNNDSNVTTQPEETFELLMQDAEPAEETIELEDAPKPKAKEKPAKETDDSEETTEEVVDETEEDELSEFEETEPTEDQLELTTPVRRKEILKKYPTLFKDFPYLEKAYYREQQFTELFPTVDEAKNAVENSRALQTFEEHIMGGSIESILDVVKKNDQNAFYKIVDNYLPNLQKVDAQAYNHVMSNVAKNLIASMVQSSRSMGENGQPLQGAAHVLHQWLFGNNNYVPPQPLAKDTPKKDEEISQREQQFEQQRLKTTVDELQGRVDNSIKATIESNIDPKKSMTDFVRRNAVREVVEQVNNDINNDTRFRKILDTLWTNAQSKNYDRASLDRIRSAYLTKAKTLLPTAIKKARNEALKGMGKKVVEDSTAQRESSRPDKKVSRPSSTNSGNGNPSKGMSTVDFFMKD